MFDSVNNHFFEDNFTPINQLIFGDNLIALKRIEKVYLNKIKCVYIDPPYNTKETFRAYQDKFNKSDWLNMMRERLEIIKKLIKEDGSIWISIDNKMLYSLKNLCDQIFGENNFVNTIVWERNSGSPQPASLKISTVHEYILVYSKTSKFKCNVVNANKDINNCYKYSDEHDGIDSQGNFYGRGPFAIQKFSRRKVSENRLYGILNPFGILYYPPLNHSWCRSQEDFFKMRADNRIFFGKDGNTLPYIKKFIGEVSNHKTLKSVWRYSEVGESRTGFFEIKKLNLPNNFHTPKPEKLIHKILTYATNPGDIVLDVFAGTGTTGAVAHKMNRKYILVEKSTDFFTHILPRLVKIVKGKDDGGVTELTGWKGGEYVSSQTVDESIDFFDFCQKVEKIYASV